MKWEDLYEAERITDNFINKRMRVNKPFQSLIGTGEYSQFHMNLKDAIGKQLKHVADNLPHQAAISTQDLLDKWIETDMPPASDYLDKDQIANYYRFCVVWGIKSQYSRMGIGLKNKLRKDDDDDTDFGVHVSGVSFDFTLTNSNLINSINDDAASLLHKSNIDDTTRQTLIDIIKNDRLNNMTIDEVAKDITDQVDSISDKRAFVIARTETAQQMGTGNYQAMVQNGVETKSWVAAGSDACDICDQNVDDGSIPVDQSFSSGDMYEPAHPNCECYTEAGEIDLSSIDIWDGS